MDDNLARAIESKNIHASPVPILVSGPILVAVQDDVVALSKDPFEIHALARVLAGHLLEVRNECDLTVSYTRVMLHILSARVPTNRIAWHALVEHEVVERGRSLLVPFEVIIHE